MRSVEEYVKVRKRRFFTVTFTLLSLLITLALIHVSVGSSTENPFKIMSEAISEILHGYPGIASYRVMRLTASLLGGMALALSGLLIQTASRNPLGDPYLLGISSGALFGVVLTFALPLIPLYTLVLRPIAAFIGGVLAYLLTLAIASKAGMTTTSLVLAGVAVGTTLYSASLLPQYLIIQNIHQLFAWSQGSFVDPEPLGETMIFLSLVISLLILYKFVDVMNALNISDDFVRELGEDPAMLRKLLTLIASLIASLTVAWYGIIGFVGLASPHVSRRLIKSGDVRFVLPPALIFGSLMTVAADAVGKSIIYPVEIPVNIIVSLVGGPALATILMGLKHETRG